jgi:hypothetical protein
MKPDEKQRTRLQSTDPNWSNLVLYPYARGELILESTNFMMKVKFATGARLRTGLVEVLSKDPDNTPITPQVLAAAPLDRVEAAANIPHVAAILRMSQDEWEQSDPPPTARIGGRRQQVVVPTERPYPATFWKSVADAYHQAVLIEGARDPAVRIADEAGVSVATVRDWIVRCRDRGLISAGQQGRVG